MNFELQISSCDAAVSGRRSSLLRAAALTLCLSLAVLPLALATAAAHGGEDHSGAPQTAGSGAPASVPVVTAERNLPTADGNFTLLLKYAPGDARTGETAQFLLRLTEQVEGGFGNGAPLPLEEANIAAAITESGRQIAGGLPVMVEPEGYYSVSYVFSRAGNYKIAFNVTTADKRKFFADFPVTVARAPLRNSFLFGWGFLLLLTFGAVGAIFYKARRTAQTNARRIVPPALAALVIFALGTVALSFLLPPFQIRDNSAVVLAADSGATSAPLAARTMLTVPKESQLLFGIKTEAVAARQITGGLKATGTVRARPDAQAVVVPPVAGKLVLRQGVTIGMVVGRGEQIGYIEQVLDVAGQVALEQQRLEVEAQQREVEARRLDLKNSALQLQGQQNEQRAKVQQARTQLAQAQRELRRAENLLEVGAAPRKRVEEAQTAVRVAEQDVAAAEQQTRLLETQIRQTNAGQTIFRAPRVNRPNGIFPLTAPVTGVVNEIKATGGQQLEAGAEILSLVNLSVVLIEASVFERDLPAVRESTRASFTTAALGSEVYTIGTADGDGRLVSIGQAVNPQTRAVPVIYEVVNPLNRLRDGMFVEVTIDTSGSREVLAVPKKAVVTEEGQSFVFVASGGETFEKRAVALGAEGAEYYEIKAGLSAGERVVTEGVYQLRSTPPTV